jgi:hypothetical protein
VALVLHKSDKVAVVVGKVVVGKMVVDRMVLGKIVVGGIVVVGIAIVSIVEAVVTSQCRSDWHKSFQPACSSQRVSTWSLI